MTESIHTKIAHELRLDEERVRAAAELLAQGGTAPFIARYRKEQVHGLTEENLLAIRDRLEAVQQTEKRRRSIIQSLHDRGLLKDDLEDRLKAAQTRAELEDLYFPFRRRKRSRANIARENGLEPLAEKLYAQEADVDPQALAAEFAGEDKAVKTPDEALAGARDIIAEWVSGIADVRQKLRHLYEQRGTLVCQVVEGQEEAAARFKPYFNWREPLRKTASHRVLAMRRGEKKGLLQLRVEVPAEQALKIVLDAAVKGESPAAEQVKLAAEDAYKRLLDPAMAMEMRAAIKEHADDEAVHVFAANLRQLLLAPPLRNTPVLAVDSNGRGLWRFVCVDPNGELLYSQVIGRKKAKPKKSEKMADDDGAETSDGDAAETTDAKAEETTATQPDQAQHHQAPDGTPGESAPEATAAAEPEASSEQPAEPPAESDDAPAETATPQTESTATESEPPQGSASDAEQPAEEQSDAEASSADAGESTPAEPEANESADTQSEESDPADADRTDAAEDTTTDEAASQEATDAAPESDTDEEKSAGTSEESAAEPEPGTPVKAEDRIAELIADYKIGAIAVGSGAGGRETAAFVRSLNDPENPNPPVVMVNDSGAIAYGTSRSGREELPDMDPALRRVVSIARRLIDPLSELVKADSRAIGVGQYQHDVDARLLRRRLGDVVCSCVCHVGVDLNKAHAALLRYVAGFGGRVAAQIIAHRAEHGPFKTIESLKELPDFPERAFENGSGFLLIRDGEFKPDGSFIHPERYGMLKQMAEEIGCEVNDLFEENWRKRINLDHYRGDDVDMPTLMDILHELQEPGVDPRPSLEPTRLGGQVQSMDELEKGQKLKGIVTNVTNFGAFVDLGIKQDGLVHVSQLSDEFVKDPSEAVQVGQPVEVTVLEVDKKRKRISLSMRQDPFARPQRGRGDSGPPRRGGEQAEGEPRGRAPQAGGRGAPTGGGGRGGPQTGDRGGSGPARRRPPQPGESRERGDKRGERGGRERKGREGRRGPGRGRDRSRREKTDLPADRPVGEGLMARLLKDWGGEAAEEPETSAPESTPEKAEAPKQPKPDSESAPEQPEQSPPAAGDESASESTPESPDESAEDAK